MGQSARNDPSGGTPYSARGRNGADLFHYLPKGARDARDCRERGQENAKRRGHRARDYEMGVPGRSRPKEGR